MTGGRTIIVDDVAALALEESQPVIYDRPIRARLLYHDPDSGAEHYVIRYPAGLQAQRHTHAVAHTIVVLEGHLVANETVVGPGAYVHFPAGTVIHHAPAGESPCLFITIFHGPFDVQAVDSDTAE